jgi:hypothetical protein
MQICAKGLVAAILVLQMSSLSAQSWVRESFPLVVDNEVFDTSKFDSVGHAAPSVVDINGDGKEDIIVGTFGGVCKVLISGGTIHRRTFTDGGFLRTQTTVASRQFHSFGI